MFSTLLILLCISSNLLCFLSNHQWLCRSATSKLACPCRTKVLTNLEPSDLWPQHQLPTEQQTITHLLPTITVRRPTQHKEQWHRITVGEKTMSYSQCHVKMITCTDWKQSEVWNISGKNEVLSVISVIIVSLWSQLSTVSLSPSHILSSTYRSTITEPVPSVSY